MVVYKDKSYLIFELDDGSVVKYDFATKQAIGRQGKPVNDLRRQFRNISIQDIINSCKDEQYGKFLAFVRRNGGINNGRIDNIGTILSRVGRFARFEQLFSAGIPKIDVRFTYTINDIPKFLLKLLKEKGWQLNNKLLEYYKANPDIYQLAYNLQFDSLNDEDIYLLLRFDIDIGYDRVHYRYIQKQAFVYLMDEYGYTALALFKYLDYLKTYEAIDDMQHVLKELGDYARMMHSISPKFDKYPRNFLTTHKIATRNYNRLKKEFSEELFQKRINHGMEHTFGEYTFIYPNSTQAIKDEAVQQNHCVASYIDDVIDGKCDILFLRRKDTPETSLVTIEVQHGRIVQARQKFNNPCTPEQEAVINKWNVWYANRNEREVLQDAS